MVADVGLALARAVGSNQGLFSHMRSRAAFVGHNKRWRNQHRSRSWQTFQCHVHVWKLVGLATHRHRGTQIRRTTAWAMPLRHTAFDMRGTECDRDRSGRDSLRPVPPGIVAAACTGSGEVEHGLLTRQCERIVLSGGRS